MKNLKDCNESGEISNPITNISRARDIISIPQIIKYWLQPVSLPIRIEPKHP